MAIPGPLRQSYDYLPPSGLTVEQVAALQPGQRLLLPFGQSQSVGVLLALKTESAYREKLRPALELLDPEPVLSANMFELVSWAASYYKHPLGDALSQALPVLLRKGEGAQALERYWRLTREGMGLPLDALVKRAPKQAQVVAMLQEQSSLNQQAFEDAGIARNILSALAEKGLIESFQREPELPATAGMIRENPSPVMLNHEQQAALDEITSALGDFAVQVLLGITGSGKTEVYLQAISACLARGKQALVLVPEIGLTPQTLQRFTARFGGSIAVLHSGLTDLERLKAWRAAKNGQARIVIGTRSAIFAPLDPGLIVVDEEHDNSYKQQEGFRYSARDLAVKRAHLERCPVLLGSATPSLETLANIDAERYRCLHLTQRAGNARPPVFKPVDTRREPLHEGLTASVVDEIVVTLAAGQQVLVFVNRRGFAPVMLCQDCGWTAACNHCDARMTVHVGDNRLRCHHCEAMRPLPRHCPSCGSNRLDFRGPGTERIERFLQQRFSGFPVLRIDRDTTSRKQALPDFLAQINTGKPCVLVGTQMLAKGHHFPDVTLVVIVDADGGLFSADFRGPERVGQLLMQVAGRAGRGDQPGKVLIQSAQSDHPLLQQLIVEGYEPFARQLLAERRRLGLPPTGFMALLRADANELMPAEQLLRDARRHLSNFAGLELIGPLPAPMTRRAGRMRVQLQVIAGQRAALHQALDKLVDFLAGQKLSSRLKWSLDIDPQDMF